MNGSEHLPEHTGAAQLVGATSPGEPNAWPANAGEFAARYNSWTPGVREEWLQRRIQSSQEAERCFLQMHEGRIEQLTAECDALRAQLDGMTTEWGVRVVVPRHWWVESMRTREECERWIANPPLRYTHQVGEMFAVVKRTAASKWMEVTD